MWRYIQLHYQDNFIAGIIQTIVIGGLTYFFILKRLIFCEKKWCFRYGRNKVPHTHYKTCTKHTNKKIHKKLQTHYNKKYSNKVVY